VGGRSPLTFNLLFLLVLAQMFLFLHPKFRVFKGKKIIKNFALLFFELLAQKSEN